MFGLPDEFTPGFLARLEKLRIRTRHRYAGLGRGMHLSPKRGSSLEFNDYRHYSPGDDFRYIDWGLYASGDRVMLRVLGGKGGKVNPSFVTGRHRIVELARRLHDLKPGGQFDFATSLANEMLSIRRAGKVFIVSDFLMLLNSVTRGLGMFTAASMDLTAVQILGGRELNGHGLDGDVEVVDSESGERLRVSIGERERAQYRDTMERLTREIKSFCVKRGLHYALYTTDHDFQQFFVRAVRDLGLAH